MATVSPGPCRTCKALPPPRATTCLGRFEFAGQRAGRLRPFLQETPRVLAAPSEETMTQGRVRGVGAALAASALTAA